MAEEEKPTGEVQKILETQTSGNNQVIALRVSLIRQLKQDNTLQNEDFVNLLPNEKIEITNNMKEIIENNPDIYGTDRAKIAAQLENVEKTVKLTFAEQAKTFGNEAKNQFQIKGKRIFIVVAILGGIAAAISILSSSATLAKTVAKK